MAELPPKPHAVLIPVPLQGHINPAACLAIKLAARGFAITYVNTEAVHHQSSRARRSASSIDHDIFADARASGLDIRYELISDGLPISFDRAANPIQFLHSLLYVFSAHVEELMRKLTRAAGPPITCLIADTFFVWPDTIANKFGIPYVSFWTEPAVVFALYYHIDLLIKNGHFASRENRKDAITYIPGVPAVEPTDLMSYLQETDTTSLLHQIIFKAFEEAKGADFVLCNSVQELEPEIISAMQQEKPFYAVGPLIQAGLFPGISVRTTLQVESDCSQWLDSKPAGSVLYVSFGSFANVSKRDLGEIAYGILHSKANFMWVLRPDIVSSDEHKPLPQGFLEESHGRGILVPWCCQMEVLSHPSVGGFLTHCGWNSVLESIRCGVPMLCFPLQTDQFTNRKLVVRDWKVGIDLGRIEEVSREEVSKRVDSLMGGEEGNEAKKMIEEARRALESAVAADGSSQKNFDQFVEDLMGYRSENRTMK
ncbi:UDP-glycosyltransferase 86A1-like [Phoenix dactylifera]|uniref:Glycosyltransferase n=1 Tax=Phoenix dactylifera TaxID=42345 RepID=A0A8B8ZZ15_PHODC|nr:UDP-glycosyltransferase 86A1-like [Phoenix dactylifera]